MPSNIPLRSVLRPGSRRFGSSRPRTSINSEPTKKAPSPRAATAGRALGNSVFRHRLLSLAAQQGRARVRNPSGIDNARGLGQAIARVKGRNNKAGMVKRTPPAAFINPVAAALQHSVRNRSVEQGANAPSITTSHGASSSVFGSIKRGLL